MRRWSATYDLVVRLLPDVALQADGVRSTNDAFRDEVEAILDDVLPGLVPADRLVTLRASEITSRFDWFGVLQRLATAVGATVSHPTSGADARYPARPPRRATRPRPGPPAPRRRARAPSRRRRRGRS